MAETKTEGGESFPASDYCYVPDAAAPSTWKLRVTATPGGKPDPAIVGAAAAALSPGGFRGNPVQIPSADRAAAVACVRRAWTEANPDKQADEMPQGIARSDDEEPEVVEPQVIDNDEPDIQVRDASKRELDIRRRTIIDLRAD